MGEGGVGVASRKKEGGADEAIGSFEEGVGALEALVAELESGELPLEKALESFERGVRLVRLLNERLNAAEEKIDVLSRAPGGELTVEPHRPRAREAAAGTEWAELDEGMDEDDGGD